jgi:hypothetical protein
VEKNIIPQVGIHTALTKYDGVNTQVDSLRMPFKSVLTTFTTRRNLGVNYVGSIVNNFRHILLFTTSDLQKTTSWKKKTQLL